MELTLSADDDDDERRLRVLLLGADRRGTPGAPEAAGTSSSRLGDLLLFLSRRRLPPAFWKQSKVNIRRGTDDRSKTQSVTLK